MADAKNYDDQFDWDDPTGGGFIDNFTATIRNPEFGTDPEYNDGETIRLMLDLELVEQPDPDIELEAGDVVHEALNLGNDSTWEILEGGVTVGRIDGKKPKPNNATGYGKLLAAAAQGRHYGDEDKTSLDNREQLVEVLRKRGSGLKAPIWDGLTFVWKRLNFSFKNSDGDWVEYQRTFPVSFVGVDAKASESGSTSTGDAASNGTADVTRDELVALAAEHDTYSGFLASVMKTHPGAESGEFGEAIMDEKGGIYAEAHS